MSLVDSYEDGMMFVCTKDTFDECMNLKLLGLPFAQMKVVKALQPCKSALFLFNMSDRRLHGLFHASSPGNANINRDAWNKGNSNSSPFPAQIEFEVSHECAAIHEKDFRHIFPDKHRIRRLDKSEVQKLVRLFLRDSRGTSASKKVAAAVVHKKQPVHNPTPVESKLPGDKPSGPAFQWAAPPPKFSWGSKPTPAPQLAASVVAASAPASVAVQAAPAQPTNIHDATPPSAWGAAEQAAPAPVEAWSRPFNEIAASQDTGLESHTAQLTLNEEQQQPPQQQQEVPHIENTNFQQQQVYGQGVEGLGYGDSGSRRGSQVQGGAWNGGGIPWDQQQAQAHAQHQQQQQLSPQDGGQIGVWDNGQSWGDPPGLSNPRPPPGLAPPSQVGPPGLSGDWREPQHQQWGEPQQDQNGEVMGQNGFYQRGQGRFPPGFGPSGLEPAQQFQDPNQHGNAYGKYNPSPQQNQFHNEAEWAQTQQDVPYLDKQLQNCNTIRELFERVGLDKHVAQFEAEQMDVESLMMCDEMHFKEMDIPLGARVKLLNLISQVRGE